MINFSYPQARHIREDCSKSISKSLIYIREFFEKAQLTSLSNTWMAEARRNDYWSEKFTSKVPNGNDESSKNEKKSAQSSICNKRILIMIPNTRKEKGIIYTCLFNHLLCYCLKNKYMKVVGLWPGADQDIMVYIMEKITFSA